MPVTQARTYVPTLRRILHRTVTYLASYSTLMAEFLTTEQATALTAFTEALNDLVEALGPEPVQN